MYKRTTSASKLLFWAAFISALFGVTFSVLFLSRQQPAKNAGKPPLLFLAEDDSRPLSYFDNGRPRGRDIDLANELAKAMGRDIRVELADWDTAVMMVQHGQADGLLGVTVSNERKQQFEFVEPVFQSNFGIFVRTNDGTTRGVGDLSGKKVAIIGVSAFPAQFLGKNPEIHLVLCGDYEETFSRLTRGEVDAVATETWLGSYWLQQHPQFKASLAPDLFASLPVSVALRKGNVELRDDLNLAVRKLKSDGTLGEIEATWRPQEVLFVTREKAWRIIAIGTGSFVIVLIGALLIWIYVLRRNIRERERAEAALQEGEEKLLTALAAANMGTFRWTVSTNLVFRDANFNSLMGLPGRPSVNTPEDLFERLHPDDRDSTRDLLCRCIQNKKPYFAEYRAIWPDRSVRWFETHAKPICNDSGETLYVTGVTRDVTEAQQAQERIRLLAHAVASIEECVAVTDKENRILYVNDAFLRIYEYDPSEVIGQPATILLASGETSIGPGEILHTTNENGAWHGELWNQSRNGRVFPITLTTSLVRDERGQVIGYVGVARDITEERASAEALRASEEKFAKAFRSSPDCIAIVDFESGKVLDTNERFEKITGYSRAEILGKRTEDVVLVLDSPARKQKIKELAQTGSVRDFEYRFLNKSREIVTVVASAEVMEINGRRCYVSINRDITDQKRAELELRRTEAKYHDIVENANDMIFTMDGKGHCLSINRAGFQIVGEDSRNTNIDLRTLIAPEQLDLARQSLELVMQGKDVAPFELDILNRKNQKLTVELGMKPVLDGVEVIAAQGIARDVTQRKELEAQLRQAQKMDAIGRLAAGVAHDFNNLLTVILWNCDAAEPALAADDPRLSWFAEIRSAVNSAAGLTKQLLAFSRKQVIQPRVVNVNEVIGETQKMLSRLIEEHVALTVIPDTALDMISIDVGQLEQVILNLVVNARDAMPDGGSLRIETMNVQLDGRPGSAPGKMPAGKYVKLSVADDGVGMDKITQARIFEPFFTTKGIGKGTGLGLATVYGIVKQNNGFIWVQSELGKGTTFTVYFPAVDRPASYVGAPKKESGDFRGTEKLLIVEDEDSLRTLISSYFAKNGYEVLSARTGNDAITICRDQSFSPALLITDVVMPGINGRELADSLRQTDPTIKVLYVSGYTDDAVIRYGLMPSGTDFVQKPFSLNDLAEKVRQSLATP